MAPRSRSTGRRGVGGASEDDGARQDPGTEHSWLDPAVGVSLSPVSDSVRREAQIVGLDEMSVPSLESIERRRYRLWVFTVVVLAIVTIGVLILPVLPTRHDLPSPDLLRILVFTLAGGFVVYAIDREVHLRRLIRLLVEERVLTASLTNRVRELASMLDAGRAVNSVLDLDRVLHQILASALDLLEAENGSIMLVEGGELRVVCARGEAETLGASVLVGEGIAGRVAETGEPLLILGQVDPGRVKGAAHRTQPVDSAMSVPLVHRDRLLGVLNVNAGVERPFTEYDLRAVSLFGEHAASAVANARLYESQRAQAAALAHQAFHDPLTDLANRVLFFERLDASLTRCAPLSPGAREGELAVLFLDLDDFKRINDTFGHMVGDDLLVAIAGRITEELRAGDTAARLGGDEFAVLLEGFPDGASVVAFADRIIARIGEPLDLHGHRVSVGSSVGIALSGPAAATPESLMRNADAALYRAKAQGRRLCQVFEPHMLLADPGMLELEADLQRALDTGELEVHYQPIYDLGTDRPVSVEALVRWRHPGQGLVAASDFLALADSSGLIVPISRWVLNEACAQLASWRRQGVMGDVSMSVNIAGAHFRRADLVTDVQQALTRAGIAESRLVLEVGEPVLMQEQEATTSQLASLRALGVQLAVDDFGTGYSSLSHLRNLPLAFMKIDRSFIEGITDDPVQAGFVRSVVDMADHLGLRLVAEGVETPEQRNLLVAVGCRLAQGWCFSRALPPDELVALVTRSGRTAARPTSPASA